MNQIECQFCNKVFGNTQMLRQHQKKTKYCLHLQNIFFSENPQMMIKECEKQAAYKDKEKIKCQFCNSIFTSIISLDQHQKRAKHCLKIQEDQAKEEAEKATKLTCQFCTKQFKTKYLLRTHQTHAKYCLKIQESQNSGEIISSLVTCKFCQKTFSSKNFNRHDAICKKKNQVLIEEIARMKIDKERDEKEIYKNLAERSQSTAERVQATIEEIAKRPTYQKNSTKNIQNNLVISNLTPLDLSQARVDSIINEKYTKNDFYEGQKGAAQVIHKHILTDDSGKSQIVCTDTERGTFHHKDLNGEHVVDYKNAHLIDRVHLPLKRKASKFASEECVKNPTAYKEIIMSESSIRELETKPGLFNRTMAQLTGKNCARPLIASSLNIDLRITEELLLENATFLTIEHILRGPEGYADYALSYPLNGRLIEEDYSNPTFIKYKDRKGDIITDHGGKMLLKMLLESVRERTYELIESNENISFEYGSIDDSIFQDEFISIVMSNI
jgi:hypothetical protein